MPMADRKNDVGRQVSKDAPAANPNRVGHGTSHGDIGRGLESAEEGNARDLGRAFDKHPNGQKEKQPRNASYAAELGRALNRHAREPGQRI